MNTIECSHDLQQTQSNPVLEPCRFFSVTDPRFLMAAEVGFDLPEIDETDFELPPLEEA